MKIIGHLDPDQGFIDPEIQKAEVLILGQIHGVALYGQPGSDVIVQIITEDDGHWFYSEYGKFTAFWMGDLQDVLDDAIAWMNENCVTHAWGWTWKE